LGYSLAQETEVRAFAGGLRRIAVNIAKPSELLSK